MDKKKVIKFVLITYLIAWAIQIPVSVYAVNNPGQTGSLVFAAALSVSMFAPLIAAIITNKTLKGMGWKPKIKGNIKWIIGSVLIPVVFTLAGAALFYVIFPDLFDTTGSYLIETAKAQGVDLAAQLGSQGMDINTYIIVSIISACTFAPLINMFVAVGEEAGWRGFLYPEINKSFGKIGTWITGGIIWGVFHFPIMLIAGYEYGTDYLGAPVLGLVAFAVFCIILGMIHEMIYDKTKCIWFPALLHGATNAIAGAAMYFINANADEKVSKMMIFGPASNGLISMIPMAVIAVIMAAVTLNGKENRS